MRTPRSACRLMRGADGRRCCLAGAALLALLFVDLAAVGDARTQEAKDARVREKELQKQLTELKKENRAREKEAKAEGKKSTGHKPGNPKGAANAPRLGGLSLLTGATAAPPPSGTGTVAGWLQWLRAYFRWLFGTQATEAEHAVKRAKRVKEHVDSDYGIDGKLFYSRPPLSFKRAPNDSRPRGTVFDVAGFGAVPDGRTDCTAAIQRAVNEASAAKGGVVVLGNGTWVTGPIELRSHVVLWLSGPSSVLKAHGNIARWPTTPYQEHPLRPAYEPRMRHRPLLFGHSLEDVRIGGGGRVDGTGMAWWSADEYERMHLAPAGLFHVVNVSGLVIEDTWFVDSAKFSVRPQFCRGVRIRNVVVDNPAGSRGTNGIVVDSCQTYMRTTYSHPAAASTLSVQDVEVTDCVVSTGFKEDAICVKSGEGEYGIALNAPSRNILVKGCDIHQGHAISVGSEMSGSVFGATFEDIFFDGRETHGFGAGSLRVKSARGRGGVVDGVVFRNIRGYKMIHVLQIHSFFGDDEGAGGAGAEAAGQEHLLPTLRNILVENVDVSVSTRTPFIIEGLPERPVTGLVVRNVTVGKWGKRGWDCKHYGGCSWAGGGCALGVVAGVEPPPLEGCIRLQAPATKRR